LDNAHLGPNWGLPDRREHYGLKHKEVEPGRWERVSVQHSWDSNNVLTNAYLFGLQRHADHHLYPRRRCQVLCSHEDSPQLPTGYAGMLWLMLVPPLWRKVMDARLVAYRESKAA
jgi:alkane 1-monooxygenase